MITNKYNLPQPLYAAISNDDYDDGGADLSVTSLWKPTQLVSLVKANKDKIEEDAHDLIPSFLGRIFHKQMEEHDTQGIKEKRLFAHVEGTLISGQFDRLLLAEGILQDYKVTTVGRYMRASQDNEWAQQLNTYAYLLALNGVEVKALQTIVLLRDWSEGSTQRLDYPSTMVQTLDLPLWPLEVTREKVVARIHAHRNPQPCTPEEMWARPPKIAVMKDGRKSAVKLFDNTEAATYFISQQTDKSKLYVEERKGSYVRCEKYCRAAPFCAQWKAIQAGTPGALEQEEEG